MQLKKGNNVDLLFLVTDEAGTVIANLATATEIKFMVKKNMADEDTDAVISKSLTSGITVNSPSTGYVKVALTPANTSIDAKKYYYALQIKYSSSNVQEVDIKESTDDVVYSNTLTIVPDIIHSV